MVEDIPSLFNLPAEQGEALQYVQSTDAEPDEQIQLEPIEFVLSNHSCLRKDHVTDALQKVSVKLRREVLPEDPGTKLRLPGGVLKLKEELWPLY